MQKDLRRGLMGASVVRIVCESYTGDPFELDDDDGESWRLES